MAIAKLVFAFVLLTKAWAGKNDPHVLLICLDGYRYDYTKLHQPPFIKKFAQTGVQADSLIPQFPTLTFPNIYGIATGMRAQKHGIVANKFYDPLLKKRYKLGNKESKNGYWYNGDPLWLAAQRAGLKSASYFWVGSDVSIKGKYPTYWFPYSRKTTIPQRTKQVVEWLKLPDDKRPRLITLYFSKVDTMAHYYGIDHPKLIHAVHEIDRNLKSMFKEIEKLGINLNSFIVSDHGMHEMEEKNLIFLSDIIDLDGLHIEGRGPMVNIYVDDPVLKRQVYKKLKTDHRFQTYLKSNFPEKFAFKKSRRAGDIIILANPYNYVRPTKPLPTSKWKFKKAMHGYDPSIKEMHGIFYAKGPMLKKGAKIPPFENIHIYPFLLDLLGVPIKSNIDGDLAVLKNQLVK